MELSYDNGKKWVLLCGDETPKEHSSTWEKEKTQHVVLLIRNGNQGTAYVDGQRVGGDEQCELKTKASKEISHFYIGGDGVKTGSQEGVSVTVTNVLLYNRPLDSTELDAFNPNKISTSKRVAKGATGEGTALPGRATGDAGIMRGSGLLPSLLLLLGLWGFAAR
ncbi:trans-sialidase, putative [Trypanosoma cruzi]|nr:trans-sialidase, putative [Trypanosoma cruzi]